MAAWMGYSITTILLEVNVKELFGFAPKVIININRYLIIFKIIPKERNKDK